MDRVGAVAVAVLVVLGGCSGFAGGGETPTASPDGTATTAATSPGPSGTGTPTPTPTPALPPDVDPSQVVAYENLPRSDREVFRDALDGTVTFGPNTTDTDVDYDDSRVGAFRRHDYVRYEDRLYRIELSPGRYYVAHTVEFVAPTPDPQGSVTAFENLSQRYREIVDRAIPDGAYRGRYRAPFGKWGPRPPPVFTGDSYVRYRNRTYSVSHAMSETRGYRLRLEAVDRVRRSTTG